jgi:competence protein ComEC
VLAKIPFIKLLLPLVAGIISYGLCQASILNPMTIIGIMSFLALALLFFTSHYFKFKYQFVNGLLASMVLLVMGYFIAFAAHYTNRSTHYSHHISSSTALVVTIIDPIIAKKKSYKTTAQVNQVINNNKSSTATGDVLLYFTQCAQMPNLQPGQQLIVQGKNLSIKNNGNPGEFDYVAYCHRKNISHMMFVTPLQYVVNPATHFSLRAYFANIRLHTIAIVNQYILDDRAIGIAQALLIGDKSEIDQETWDAYSRTGIVHIIAISGMHMGLIYQGLLWLLLLINIFKKNKWLAILISLAGMWYFACITGLPASVMRASVMFTFLAIGDILGQTKSRFNLLLASSFLLLVFNPNWLYDIGFQLSYAAVFGIMLFIPISKRWFFSNNIFVQKGYELIMATTAAQLFTLPICLHYFHQFPLAFMLANLVAIPATSFVLYLEIALLLLAWCKPIALLLGKLIAKIIVFVNACITWLASLKDITIFNIYISATQMYLLLFITALLFLAYFNRKIWTVFAIFFCLIIFLLLQIQLQVKTNQQSYFMVYHIPKKTGMDIMVGKHHEAIQCHPLQSNDIKNASEPARVRYKAIDSAKLVSKIGDSVMQISVINNIKIAEVGATCSVLPNIKLDYVVLTNNCLLNLNSVDPQQVNIIIADGSNSLWKIDKWKKEAETLHLRFHSTAENGAYIKTLNL